jgi:tRNA(Ile)-lysidine synthase
MSDAPKKIHWPEAARALRARIQGDAFEPSVREHLRGAGDVLVACSGGADSVYLLCLLVAESGKFGLRLRVAHYNHRWRGADSAADAAFVESLARAFDLPYLSEARPDNEAAFTETTARALRLDFLRKAALRCNCGYIVYGHQLDDIIETQLQRIARGCASDGLAAPRPVATFGGKPTHLRPLLHLRAGDIRMALNATGIPWREDSSNDDVSIARNALRHQIIPDLSEALVRDPAVGAARSRRLLEEDAAALDTLSRERLPEAYAHATVLQRSTLRTLPPALLRRALTEWLGGHDLIDSVGAPAMDLLMETLRSPRERYRMSAGAHYILIGAETLRWEHEDASDPHEALQPARLEPGEPVFLSSGYLMQAEVIELDDPLRQRIESGGIDPETEAVITYRDESSFEIRAWQPGDRFHPLGAPGGKKLKDCFIDRKIPSGERKTRPLVLNASGEVVWVPGFPPAESYKIEPSTKKALRLTYQTTNPL